MRQARDEEPAEPQAPVQDGAAPQPRKRRRATLNELTSQVFCFFTVTTLSFEPVSAGRRLRLWVQAAYSIPNVKGYIWMKRTSNLRIVSISDISDNPHSISEYH